MVLVRPLRTPAHDARAEINETQGGATGSPDLCGRFRRTNPGGLIRLERRVQHGGSPAAAHTVKLRSSRGCRLMPGCVQRPGALGVLPVSGSQDYSGGRVSVTAIGRRRRSKRCARSVAGARMQAFTVARSSLNRPAGDIYWEAAVLAAVRDLIVGISRIACGVRLPRSTPAFRAEVLARQSVTGDTRPFTSSR